VSKALITITVDNRLYRRQKHGECRGFGDTIHSALGSAAVIRSGRKQLEQSAVTTVAGRARKQNATREETVGSLSASHIFVIRASAQRGWRHR
jgi:hypothetical protein